MFLTVVAAVSVALPQVWRTSNASVARAQSKRGNQNYPQPKALAGLAFFVYVSRECALLARKAVARLPGAVV
jgi:hypothetical protein